MQTVGGEILILLVLGQILGFLFGKKKLCLDPFNSPPKTIFFQWPQKKTPPNLGPRGGGAIYNWGIFRGQFSGAFKKIKKAKPKNKILPAFFSPTWDLGVKFFKRGSQPHLKFPFFQIFLLGEQI